jgi:hypothetical protein
MKCQVQLTAQSGLLAARRLRPNCVSAAMARPQNERRHSSMPTGDGYRSSR